MDNSKMICIYNSKIKGYYCFKKKYLTLLKNIFIIPDNILRDKEELINELNENFKEEWKKHIAVKDVTLGEIYSLFMEKEIKRKREILSEKEAKKELKDFEEELEEFFQ